MSSMRHKEALKFCIYSGKTNASIMEPGGFTPKKKKND